MSNEDPRTEEILKKLKEMTKTFYDDCKLKKKRLHGLYRYISALSGLRATCPCIWRYKHYHFKDIGSIVLFVLLR